MNQTQKIGVGLVVLAGLAFAAWQTGKKDAQTGFATKDSKKADLPEIKGPEDVDRLVITNADKGVVELAKKDDKWRVVKPVDAPANQSNVKSLIDNLKELKATEVIEQTATEDHKKTYQLSADKAVRIQAFKGADKKVDDTFGKSGGRGQTVMVDGKPSIYVAQGYQSYIYTREVKNWRETEIFKFDDANATSFTIDRGKAGLFSFTKGDKWAGTFKGQPIADLDEDKIKQALGYFKNLNAEDFGDGKTPADTGLDAPESTVTVQLKDGAGKYALKVGKIATGTSRYAMKDGDATVFVIGTSPSEWATAEPSKFEKAKDAGAKAGKDGGPATAAATKDKPKDPHGH